MVFISLASVARVGDKYPPAYRLPLATRLAYSATHRLYNRFNRKTNARRTGFARFSAFKSAKLKYTEQSEGLQFDKKWLADDPVTYSIRLLPFGPGRVFKGHRPPPAVGSVATDTLAAQAHLQASFGARTLVLP